MQILFNHKIVSIISSDPNINVTPYEKIISEVLTKIGHTNALVELDSIKPCLEWMLAQNGLNLPSIYPEISIDLLMDSLANLKDLTFSILSKRPDAPYTAEQLNNIYQYLIMGQGKFNIPNYSKERILYEIKWWIDDIGLPSYYFRTNTLMDVASHLLINHGHEIEQRVTGNESSQAYMRRSIEDGYVYIGNEENLAKIEADIDHLYVNKEVFISGYQTKSRVIIFIVKNKSPLSEQNAPESLPEETFGRYQKIIKRKQDNPKPLILLERIPQSSEMRLTFALTRPENSIFFSRMERIFTEHELYTSRKYFHALPDKKLMLHSFYFDRANLTKLPSGSFRRLLGEINDVALLPANPLSSLYEEGVQANKILLLNSVVHFVHLFSSKSNVDVEKLKKRFPGTEDILRQLTAIQRELDVKEFQLDSVMQTFIKYPSLRDALVNIFDLKFNPSVNGDHAQLIADLKKQLPKTDMLQRDKQIIYFAMQFIEHIERTNFYLPQKSALGFKLSGSFLDKSIYKEKPFALFFITGDEFCSFHTRFQDIARGGIRIVVSPSKEKYFENLASVYAEGYYLAATQELKNKDIAEGGAKGIILLNEGLTLKQSTAAFQAYVDTLLDLTLPGKEKYIKNSKEELLFLGPDENTADLMDWACEYAKKRGYVYHKGFTTGKSSYLGGVSHIDYGMTTLGVHEYVLRTLAKLGLKEEETTKVMTGGPDGDLGSNEMLISKDKILSIVDGGGVLYDPQGLDRSELRRLARTRTSSNKFNPEKLSPMGFRVLLGDQNIVLPDNTLVENGVDFRNSFHLHPLFKADVFVPCGGRPNSINMTNWEQLFDEKGLPKYKFIVEGANLFINQEARLELEKRGIPIFKDSSTNKGGVTSSSLEVLSGLALADIEFQQLMTAPTEAEASDFRKQYIQDIMGIITKNAQLEFSILWEEAHKTGTSFTKLSDKLSETINKINSDIMHSDLFDNLVLRKKVLTDYIPKTLLTHVGIEALFERIPVNYQKAMFSAELARKFVYKYGCNPSREDYRKFINSFL